MNKIYECSRIVRFVFYLCLNITIFPLTIIYLSRYRFIRLIDSRIGHLTINTEIFLKKYRINKFKYIAIASNKPCNKQLLKMFKQELKILQIPSFIFNNNLFRALSSNKCILPYNELYYNIEEYRDVTDRTNIKFTEEENEKAKEKLKKMGVDSWFVCFSCRDKVYVKNNKHDYRNSDINTYRKAMEYVVSKGGYAIRMGAKVEKKIKESSGIIDYASNYYDEFMDIWLIKNCKVFVGDTNGLFCLAYIFDKYLVITNFIPMTDVFNLNYNKNIIIPKKVFDGKKEITYINILYDSKEYKDRNLKIIDNTEDEIYDSVKKMLRQNKNEKENKNNKISKD